MKKLLVPSLVIACAIVAAQAQTTFIKADNTTSMNLAPSYTANTTVPGTLDTIQVDNTLTTGRSSAIGGNLSVNAITYNATSQFQITATAGASLTIGAGGVTKTGGGNLIFANAVTLGASQVWTITASGGGGNLQMNGAFNDGGNTLNVNGNGTFDLRGNNTFGSNVIIDTAVSVNSASATVALGGLNTFNALSIPNGRVQVGTIGNFGQASNAGDGGTNTIISLGSNGAAGIFEYTGTNASTNRTISIDNRSLNSGGVVVTSSTTTLTISGNLASNVGTSTSADTGWTFGGAGNLVLSGIISDKPDITGKTSVTKSGNGILTLSGNNTYEGGTTVSVGTLLVNNTSGSGTGSGAVVVNSGATLGGNGTISGATTVGGTIAAGNSIGVLNTGSLTINATGTLDNELGRSGVTPVSDRVNVTGSVSLESGANLKLTLYTGLTNPVESDIFFLISNDGVDAISGIFTELNGVATTLTEGSTFSWNSQSWKITYQADFGTSSFTGGNDLALQVVPEPTVWALLALSGTVLMAVRRRRHHS